LSLLSRRETPRTQEPEKEKEKEKGKNPETHQTYQKQEHRKQKAKKNDKKKNQENHKTGTNFFFGNSPQVAEWSLRRNEWMGSALDQTKSGSSREKTGVVRAESWIGRIAYR
jgi:hypothetical protein